MFTFGYKTTLSSILRSLASIGIGLVMIFDNEASETVVKVVAAFPIWIFLQSMHCICHLFLP